MKKYRHVLLWTVLVLNSYLAGMTAAWAHGDEDHSQPTPPSPAAKVTAVSNQNKLVLSSDTVELVALVDSGSLLVYLDRFDSNQPIAGANLILEVDGQEAIAHELQPGLYQVDAPWANTAGTYELLLMIDSVEVTDLLDGTLLIEASPMVDLDAPQTTPTLTGWVFDRWQLGVAGFTLLLVLVILFRVRSRTTTTAAVLVLALLATPEPVLAHGGEDHSADSGSDTAIHQQQSNGDKARRLPSGEVYLPKPNQRTLNITTQLAAVESVPTSYQLTAHVQASPNHSGQVQAAQSGRVDTAKVALPHLGQWVDQGQLVGHIQPIAARFEQGNQQAQQAELSSALRLAKQRHARLIKLKGSVPQQQIDEALNQIDSLKARLSAVVNSLRGLEPLYAPISGFITTVSVTPGQVVESQDTLFEIVDPSRVQVEALAYDRKSTLIESAYGVSRDGAHLDLRLLGVGVNLKGHAIPLLFEVEVDNPPLAIGEALTVYVSAKQRIQGIVLPRSSLVKGNQGEDLVWIHPRAERFAPRPVRWSALNKDQIAVTEGLDDGDRVVIQGATLLSQIR